MRAAVVMPKWRPKFVAFSGGLDVVSPPLTMKGGIVIGSENYEAVLKGGYESIGGYECFDGRPRPSDASITVLGAQSTFTGITVGATLTGTSSGATGVAAYANSTLVVLTKVVGTFVSGEMLWQGATAVGVTLDEPTLSATAINTYTAAAADIYRADIGRVPGSGLMRGLAILNNTVYAFRDNAGGTAQAIYKSSSSGWTAVPLLYELSFTAGSGTAPAEGATITKGAVSAVLKRLVVESGDFATANAAGRLIIAAPSGGSFTAGAFTAGMTGTASGAETAITLAPGGRWVFKAYNFFGGASTKRLYGVDGKNRPIEFDGTIVVPLNIGDTGGLFATTLEVHKDHLWLAISSSLIRSGIGTPYQWSVISGGGEFGTGDNISELWSVPGSEDQAALLVLGRDRSSVGYGDDTTFKVTPLSTEVGARPFSAQSLGRVVALDDRGMRDFTPTQAFGNFNFTTITDHILPEVTNINPTASLVDRNKGRYRLFLDDGRYLCGTPSNSVTVGGATTANRWSWLWCRLPFVVNVTADGEISGVTRQFIAGSDGFVYETGVGRSFNGASRTAWIKLAYTNLGLPGFITTFRRFDLEVKGQSTGSINFQAEFDYGNVDNPPSQLLTDTIPPPATRWDIGNWDLGVWDGQYAGSVRLRAEGEGENVSMSFYNETSTELPHELSGCMVHTLPRRRIR